MKKEKFVRRILAGVLAMVLAFGVVGPVAAYGGGIGIVPHAVPIDLAALIAAGVDDSGPGWEFTAAGASPNIFRVLDDTPLTLTGGSLGSMLNVSINVVSGLTADITIQNLHIHRTLGSAMAASGNLNLTIEGVNTLQAAGAAGLGVSSGAHLTINGTGTLTARGDLVGSIGSAGIGGSTSSATGTITINGGTINAYGGGGVLGAGGGAGIGGGALVVLAVLAAS